MTTAVDTATTAADETAQVATEVETPDFDLARFKDAVENVISDPSDISKEDINKARVEYRALSRKGMTAARNYVESEGTKAVMEGNLPQAQALIKLGQELKKAPSTAGQGKGSSTRPTDPTEAYLQDISVVQLAYSLVALNKPKEVAGDVDTRLAAILTEDAQTQGLAYREWIENKFEGEEPEAPEFVKQAARVSLGRAPKGQGRKGKAIEEAKAAEEAAQAAETVDPAAAQAEAYAEQVG